MHHAQRSSMEWFWTLLGVIAIMALLVVFLLGVREHVQRVDRQVHQLELCLETDYTAEGC